MSEEKRKVYTLVMVLALVLCGFLMGVFAMGLYRDSQSQQDDRAWKMVASDDIDENACVRVAVQQGHRRDKKFLDWCMSQMAKVPHPPA